MTDDRILRAVLRRTTPLFGEDVSDHRADLEERVHGARVLVVGAAGSIGSAFVHQLVPLSPSSLHLVDVGENNLVELVRDLRSGPIDVPRDFRALPVPMGGPELAGFLSSERSYDFVINFAAVKHVRSEKDPFSLMYMVYTNVGCLRELVEAATSVGSPHVFSVSSDKAVNPENAMGASKALMERLLLAYADRVPVSSARFANVAFSDGSLLYGFERRLEKGQPIAAPVDVRRYFISHEEAGQLCLLAAFLGGNREIFVPRLDPEIHLLTFAEIAELFLDLRELRPFPCASEEEARSRAVSGDVPSGTWPCFFFESDTTGEKMVEEFVAADEHVDWGRFSAVGVVSANVREPRELLALVDSLAEMRSGGAWTKEDVLGVLRRAVPELRHEDRGRSLDERM